MFLALLLLLTAAGAVAEGTSGAVSLTVGVREINKNGDIYMSLTPAELEAAGIHVHDMIKATVNGKTIEMPVEYTLDHALFGQPYCLIENGDVLLLVCRAASASKWAWAHRSRRGTDSHGSGRKEPRLRNRSPLS